MTEWERWERHDELGWLIVVAVILIVAPGFFSVPVLLVIGLVRLAIATIKAREDRKEQVRRAQAEAEAKARRAAEAAAKARAEAEWRAETRKALGLEDPVIFERVMKGLGL
jgi:hypothetical protein